MFEKEINSRKLTHMNSVGVFMRENAYKYGLNADEMYVVGLLHDVGYLRGRHRHSSYGANLISDVFDTSLDSSALQAIRLHDTLCDKWEDGAKDNPVLFLLIKADLSVDTNGCFVGRKARLKDIAKRYGKSSHEYEVAVSLIDYTFNNEERFLKT